MKRKTKRQDLRGLSILMIVLYSINTLSAQANTFTDPRDNQSYRIKTFQKDLGLGITVTQTWMIDNLNYEMPNSWCYENDQKNCQEYGRLYTWEAAKNACPEGWHLPTEVEWQQLTHQFVETGLDFYDSDQQGAMYKILIKGGSSGFDALLGGYRITDGSFLDLGADGYYWSATETGGGYAYYFYFGGDDQRLYRYDNDQGFGLSVRCLQN